MSLSIHAKPSISAPKTCILGLHDTFPVSICCKPLWQGRWNIARPHLDNWNRMCCRFLCSIPWHCCVLLREDSLLGAFDLFMKCALLFVWRNSFAQWKCYFRLDPLHGIVCCTERMNTIFLLGFIITLWSNMLHTSSLYNCIKSKNPLPVLLRLDVLCASWLDFSFELIFTFTFIPSVWEESS